MDEEIERLKENVNFKNEVIKHQQENTTYYPKGDLDFQFGMLKELGVHTDECFFWQALSAGISYALIYKKKIALQEEEITSLKEKVKEQSEDMKTMVEIIKAFVQHNGYTESSVIPILKKYNSQSSNI